MQIWTDLSLLPAFKRAVITIGSYDGVHLGHRHILTEVCRLAQKIDGESVVITFDPHPRLVVNPNDDSLRLITNTPEKCRILADIGIDHTVLVPFDKAFSELSPEAYIHNFLYRYFQPHTIIVGYDHRFGHDRSGDMKMLRENARSLNYEVAEIPAQTIDDVAVSSTKIRRAVEAGDIKTANNLLGHKFSLNGTVIQGQKLGRKLGYPTANLSPQSPHTLIPPDGIYAVEVLVNHTIYQGMLYIGMRPTIDNNLARSIEVNILDFEQDIYGQTIVIDFIDFLRGEQKFDDLNALIAQMGRDKLATLAVFAQYSKPVL